MSNSINNSFEDNKKNETEPPREQSSLQDLLNAVRNSRQDNSYNNQSTASSLSELLYIVKKNRIESSYGIDDYTTGYQDWYGRMAGFANGIYNDSATRSEGYQAGYGEYYTGRQTEYDALIEEGKKYYDYFSQYGDLYREGYKNDFMKEYGEITDSAKANMDYVARQNDYWAQWESEDAYNKALEEQKQYEEMLNLNLDAYANETAELEAKANNLRENMSWWEKSVFGEAWNKFYDFLGRLNNSAEIAEGFDGKYTKNDLLNQYNSEIVNRKNYYNSAKHIQDEVKNRESAQKLQEEALLDPDFDKYVQKGISFGDRKYAVGGSEYMKNPNIFNKITGYRGKNGDLIALLNVDSGIREQALKMSDEQFETYNYLFGKYGREKANEYFAMISNQLDNRVLESYALMVNDNWFLETPIALAAGVDNTLTGMVAGMSNMFSGNEETVNPDMLQRLDSVLASDEEGFTRVTHDAASAIGGMLPSIGVSVLTGSPLAGTAVMGMSAAGNAYNEMISLGYNKQQARTYGVLIGVSETTLQYALGGIGKLGGKVWSAAAKTSFAKAINNALAKISITAPDVFKLLGNMGSEGLEEGLQTVLEPAFKSLATGEDFESPKFSEIAYNTLLGAITSFAFEGSGTVSDIATGFKKVDVGTIRVARSYAAYALNNMDKNSIGYIAAQKLVDKINNKSSLTVNDVRTVIREVSNEIRNAGIVGELESRGVDALISGGLEMAPGTSANRAAYKMQKKSDKGKRISNYSIGKLYSSMSESQTRTAVQTRLKSDGVSEVEARQLGNTVTDVITGREVSNSKISEVIKNSAARSILSESIGAKISEDSSVSDVKAAIKSYQNGAKATLGGNVSKTAQNGSAAKFSVSENADGGYDVVAEANGERIALPGYTFKSQKQAEAAVYAMTLGMRSEGLKGLVTISESLPQGVSLGNAAIAFNVFYNQGKQGKAMSAAKNTEFLSLAQRQYAYNCGIIDGLLEKGRNKNSSTEVLHKDKKNDIINKQNSKKEKNYESERTDEFRRIQEESRRMSEEDRQSYRNGSRKLDLRERKRLAVAFRQELSASRSGESAPQSSLVNHKTGKTIDILENVDGDLFHDIFEIARNYLKNGELVDLHDHYDNAICYISNDGLCGFAIENNGNLVSVFNLGEGGFLDTISEYVKEKGATHLDCYNSDVQPLTLMYERKLGFKTASIMDYNMEYDHDNIAENHGMPKVAFMVNTEAEVETREFNKDQYDEAVEYQRSFVDDFNYKKDQITGEDSAIWRYKSSESYKINEAIRSGRELTDEESAFVEELDRELEKTPKYSGVTYRNISFDMQGQEAFDAFVAEHVEGEDIIYPAYTSTSKSEIGYLVDGELTAHIEIYSENGHDISKIGNEKEQEVLFDRKTRFYVKSISYDGKTANIVLEEIAYGEEKISRSSEGNRSTQQRYSAQSGASSMQQMQVAGSAGTNESVSGLSKRDPQKDILQRNGLRDIRTKVNSLTENDNGVQEIQGESGVYSDNGARVRGERGVAEGRTVQTGVSKAHERGVSAREDGGDYQGQKGNEQGAVRRSDKGNNSTQQRYDSESNSSEMQRLQKTLPEKSDDNMQNLSRGHTARDTKQQNNLSPIRKEINSLTENDNGHQEIQGESGVYSDNGARLYGERSVAESRTVQNGVSEAHERGVWGVGNSEIISKGSVKLKTGEIVTSVKNLTKEMKDVVEAGKRLGTNVVIADIKKGKKNIDGLWDGKTLYINPKPNSGNPMFVLLKHELTHFTEVSSKYGEFLLYVTDSKAFAKWLKDNGFKNSQEYIAKIISDYNKIGKNWDNKEGRKKAQCEMVANFVGDVLFVSDNSLERFVNELSPDRKHTFGDFVRDFIAWIKKVLGKTDEVAMLEKKYAKLFKDAKTVAAKEHSATEKESSYSVSPDLDSELDTVLNGTFDASKNEVYLGETSNFMTEIIGANAFSLYMPASKAYSSLVTEEEYNKKPYYTKQDNYHGIGKAAFIEILEKSETPIAAFAASHDESGNKRQNRIVLVTDKLIRDVQSGKNGYAVVVEEVDTKGLSDGKRVNANKTITIYPRTQLLTDIQNAIIDGRILNFSKKGEHLFAGVRGSNPQAAIRKDVLDKNIAHFWANVKWEKQKNKTFSTKEAAMPSAIRLALEKAGYIDQDGHIKYMQESEDLSQDGDDSSYSYTHKDENGVDNYTEEQYNNFGWVRANNIINAGYWRNFTENFAQAVSGNYNYPKNKKGDYMIDVYDAYDFSGVADIIIFASGIIESPNVSKIIKINSSDSFAIEETRRDIYALERRGIQCKAGNILNIYIKTDIIRFGIGRGNSEKNARHNYGFDTKRSSSEAKANPIVEFHINEKRGTITTTYQNGEVVTENLSGQDSSYSYTHKDENRVDNYTEEQYNNFGWARNDNIVSYNNLKDLHSKLQSKRSLHSFPQSMRGEAIVAVNDHPEVSLEVNNTLLFIAGRKDSPRITRVIKIDLYNETDISELEKIIYEAENGPWSRARSIVANMFESGLVREYRPKDFPSYQEYKAEARQRVLGQEGGGDNRNNQQQNGRANDTGENSGDEITQYFYAPKKSETVDELVKLYNEKLITEEEFKERLVGNKKDDPISIARMTEEAADTTPDIKRRRGKVKGDGERDTIISGGKADIFSKEFKKEVGTDEFIQKYKTITNEDTLRLAAEELDREGYKGVEDWLALNPERASVVDIVKGFILLDRYRRLGHVEGQVRVAQKLSEMGTAAGQSVQSFTILRRLDSAAMLAYSQKSMEKAFKTMAEGKSDAWLKKHTDRFKLTDEDIEFIFNRTILATTLPDGRDKDILISQIAQRLQDKLPPEKGQGLKALQRISMLLNPKTIIRNIVGNVSIAPVHWVSDWVGTVTDITVSKVFKTGVRTTSAIPSVKENVKAFGRGAYESYDDFRKKINTQMKLDRFNIDKAQGKSFDEYGKMRRLAQALNAMDRLTSFALAVGDRPFYEYWFTRSINAQMRINKVDVPTAEMIEIATQEALQRTWQDDNDFTRVVSEVKRGLNIITVKGYGLGDVIIKFTKTPANIAKAIYDLSPVGFVSATRAAFNLKNAVKSGKNVATAQKNFVNSFSKAAAGTMLYVIMVALFNAGLLTGKSDEDKDVAAFERWVQGIPSYSIKLGGKWFSYEWMQPIGSAAAIISDFMQSKDDETGPWDSILMALKSGGNIFVEQSFLQSFQRLFSADSVFDGVWDMIASDPSAWVPQIFSQFANLFDEKRRVTFDKANPTKTLLNAIKYKIPGLRNTLTEDVDVFGRDIPNSQANVGNAFFNPANTYVDTSDAVTDHVYGLYKELGSKAMIPPKVEHSIEMNDKRITLSAYERAEYQHIMGGVSYKIIEGLLASELYNSYSSAEKEIIIKKVYLYAKNVAYANYNTEITFEMVNAIHPYISRNEFNAMTDEQKIEIYRAGILREYSDFMKSDKDGVIAYFENEAARSAILDASKAYDIDKVNKLLEAAHSNISRYSADEEDATEKMKSFNSSTKSSLTKWWKVQYRLASVENNFSEMLKIEDMLVEIGIYGKYSDVRKKLKEWLEDQEEWIDDQSDGFEDFDEWIENLDEW